MLVHEDFSLAVIVTPDRYRWVASPQPGVERMMLDRIGGEQARATSLVRYAAGSRFPAHGHPQGEEILVLDGIFSDEDGNYPRGWYLRNPPGSAHAPASEPGALIFVKLRQMQATQRDRVRVDTRDPGAWRSAGAASGGQQLCPLYADANERVWLARVPGGAPVLANTPDRVGGGTELLVIDGMLRIGEIEAEAGSWARLPSGHGLAVTAGVDGATVYLKTGHLPATSPRCA